MTTATDEAARIRAAFRAAGFTGRDISVRASYASMCSEIRVVVRNVEAPLAWVRDVAEGAQRIRRCEITGDVLGGGNRYVTVEHDSMAREILSRRHADAVQRAVERLSPDDTNRLEPVHGTDSHVGLDRLRIVPADVATGQKTAISAGKYLGRKLFVEVITDGQGYSATRVEYQVTRWLSILSSISTIGRTSANVRVSKDY